MSRQRHRLLGFGSFSAHLKARGIPRAWAFQMKGTYQRLAVELRISEWDWLDIPLSRLQGCLSIISSHTVRQVLADARVLSGDGFRRYVKALRGERQPSLRGIYRLEPAQRPAHVDRHTQRALRGQVFASTAGEWYLLLQE